ncbi:MAG: serine kinase [Peptococcaceae bacterium BRH_c4a]|nr:MAG: serine kinase [Peptococcaceae bacterium BRH_c4a]
MVRVQVPATTANLGPGFDCLGMALQLYNSVEMSLTSSSGLYIEVQGEGSPDIPRNENNMVYQAALRVFKMVGNKPAGLRLKLINNIPIARGLGSSSAAIAGGMIAANILSGNTLTHKEIINLAHGMEGHPDNLAAAVLGGIVVAVSTEGEIRFQKIPPPKNLRTVVAIPDFTLSTRTAREALPQQIPLSDAAFNLGRVALLVAALFTGDINQFGPAMEDRLHQPYRTSLVPGMKKVFAAAKLAGAKGVALSGAGPAIIAYTDDNVELIARVMRETFRQNGISAKSLILGISPVGARALEIK